MGYSAGMTFKEFYALAWNKEICGRLSWRGILAQRYGYQNINLAAGGSSNQKQLRLAKLFFSSDDFKNAQEKFKKIVVLWGITSTSRNELYSLEKQKFVDVNYSTPDIFSKFFLKHVYDHGVEVANLRMEMLHWNRFFDGIQVENHWFDSFNTHSYFPLSDTQPMTTRWNITTPREKYAKLAGKDWPSYDNYVAKNWENTPAHIIEEIARIGLNDQEIIDLHIENQHIQVDIDRMIDSDKTHRDLLSMLKVKNNLVIDTQKYHTSMWQIDDQLLPALVDIGILNPYSFHPTQKGHEMIADYLASKIGLEVA